jgi:hypothetical protein
MIPKIVNSIGLVLDIIGAWLVAIEVVKQFRGCKYSERRTWAQLVEGAKESEEYENWQILNHKWMLGGLVLLTIGFLLQLASNWLPRPL